MKKLFAVAVKGSKEKPVATGFSKKMEAKKARDVLNQQDEKEYIVVPDYDHHRYQGDK
jgi:hypothetical protein